MATQPQKNKLIARISEDLEPGTIDKDQFQVFLGDPESMSRLTEFINEYERRHYPPVSTVGIPVPTFPDWSKGRVLTGAIHEPAMIDFTVMANPWFHPRQTGDDHKDNRPSGHEILAALVASYKAGEDKKENTYEVVSGDAIHGHFGLKELMYLEANWKTLPEPFKAWAKGKLLYGWRDVVRNDDGYLNVPYLNCNVDKPYVNWYNLDNSWNDNEPALLFATLFISLPLFI